MGLSCLPFSSVLGRMHANARQPGRPGGRTSRRGWTVGVPTMLTRVGAVMHRTSFNNFVLVAAPLFESGDGLGGDANLFPFTEPILSNAASCAFSFPAPPPKNGATKMMSLKHPNQLACWCVYCCCWSVLCLARLTGKEQESLEYEVPSSQ